MPIATTLIYTLVYIQYEHINKVTISHNVTCQISMDCMTCNYNMQEMEMVLIQRVYSAQKHNAQHT